MNYIKSHKVPLIFILLFVTVIVGFGIVYALTAVTDSFDNSSKIATSGNVTIGGGQAYMSTTTTWSCGAKFVDSRDGKIYNTVVIGTQCWMQQNLNVGVMVTGTTTQTNDGIIQKYCYNNSETYCSTYGGLYQWDEAMQYVLTPGTQGICPSQWHIPTHYEFTDLERAVCTSGSCTTDFPYDYTTTGVRGTNEGTTLKSAAGLFKGLLAGFRYANGTFVDVGAFGYFWSSVPSGTSAWRRYLSSAAQVNRIAEPKTYGYSLRCLKD